MCNNQFIVFLFPNHPYLPSFVILKLDAMNISPLSAGLILGFVKHAPSGSLQGHSRSEGYHSAFFLPTTLASR